MNSSTLKPYTSYLPYIKEGLHSLRIDLFICFVGAGTLLLLGIAKAAPWFLLVFPFYLFAECFMNYRIMLLAVLEVHMGLVQKEQLQLVKIKKAPELVGKWETVLTRIYPDHKYIEKTICCFKRADGSAVSLRCVFYGEAEKPAGKRKSGAASAGSEELGGFEEVEYGRYSKVILHQAGRTVRRSGLWNRADFLPGSCRAEGAAGCPSSCSSL